MKICEVRDLDGPNLFLYGPAIKLEVAAEDGDVRISTAARTFLDGNAVTHAESASSTPADLMSTLIDVVLLLHDRCDRPHPITTSRALETPGHFAVAFSWQHRRFAEALGRLALEIVIGEAEDIPAGIRRLQDILASEPEDDDAPEMIANADRAIPIIAITGTNGKTTTSRLTSSILRHAGQKVGMTSSAGVYIDKEQVLEGDYSGPSGAQRVFDEPGVDVAVLETARGGMLLRGLAYEQSDVSVVTNVSPDHLGLHGIHTVEGLAEVKSLVARTTKQSGLAVLNADDPLVLRMKDDIRARPFLITRNPASADVQAHIDTGGWALTVDAHNIIWWHDGASDVLTSLADIPMTFGGRASHMVENALCAAAGCLALGLDAGQVRAGLSAFRSSSRDNRGRLNVYELNDATIIIDFAHNEAGLRKLLEFARHFLAGDGTLTAVVGTAGDREDEVFQAIGRIGAEQAECVILKDSMKYLRGREPGEMLMQMRQGVRAAKADAVVEEAGSEREASLRAFERVTTGDVVAVMCIEDYDFLLAWLDERGKIVS